VRARCRSQSLSLSLAEKDALILRLLARVEELAARVAALEAENAALHAKLDLPPKTPDNSSTPPAQGHKANAPPGRRGKSRAHAGAHRPLHPNPTRRCEIVAAQCPHCRTDVSGVGQVARERYDCIEIPQIQPDVTRVTLYGGICPGCGVRSRPHRRPGSNRVRRLAPTCAPSSFTCAPRRLSLMSSWRG